MRDLKEEGVCKQERMGHLFISGFQRISPKNVREKVK